MALVGDLATAYVLAPHRLRLPRPGPRIPDALVQSTLGIVDRISMAIVAGAVS